MRLVLGVSSSHGLCLPEPVSPRISLTCREGLCAVEQVTPLLCSPSRDSSLTRPARAMSAAGLGASPPHPICCCPMLTPLQPQASPEVCALLSLALSCSPGCLISYSLAPCKPAVWPVSHFVLRLSCVAALVAGLTVGCAPLPGLLPHLTSLGLSCSPLCPWTLEQCSRWWASRKGFPSQWSP